MTAGFWDRLTSLVAEAGFVVDRAKGTRHPRYPDTVYPLDYGHLTGTTGGDGAAIDAWRGSKLEPSVDAVLCTVDLVKRDAEVKVLLGCTASERERIREFHRSAGMDALLLEREPG